MVAAVEVVAAHLRLATAAPPLVAVVLDLAALPGLACNIFL